MEKKPESTSIATTMARRLLSEKSSTCLASEDHLEHELAAEIREHEEHGAGHDAVERDAAAPAVAMTTHQDGAEDEPAEHRKDDLVREPERLAEEIFREQRAADERKRQQHVADGDEPEQEALQRQQRRQRVRARIGHCVMQSAFEPEQQNGLQRGHDQQGVRD